MWDKVAELVDTTGGGRRPLYQAMRDVVASIALLYQHAAKDLILSQENKVRTNDRSTQTIQQIQGASQTERSIRTPSKKTRLGVRQKEI